MVQIVGLLIVLGLLGSALIAGGGSSLSALPYELGLIGGMGLGTLLLSNDQGTSLRALSAFWRILSGPRWSKRDYAELLGALQALIHLSKYRGLAFVEVQLNDPKDSVVFERCKRLSKDRRGLDLIRTGFDEMAFGAHAKKEGKLRLAAAAQNLVEAERKAVAALHNLADALPALGIVAAVIGIIRAMGAIDQSPDTLGPLVAAALIGTLLGVVLSYGFVGPIATRYDQILEADAARYDVVFTALSSYMEGASPAEAMALARNRLDASVRPENIAPIDLRALTREKTPAHRAA